MVWEDWEVREGWKDKDVQITDSSKFVKINYDYLTL
jgi:hypothetical protein